MLTLSCWVSLAIPSCTGSAGPENTIKKAGIARLTRLCARERRRGGSFYAGASQLHSFGQSRLVQVALEGILKQLANSAARDRARIVVGILDGEIGSLIQLLTPHPQRFERNGRAKGYSQVI